MGLSPVGKLENIRRGRVTWLQGRVKGLSREAAWDLVLLHGICQTTLLRVAQDKKRSPQAKSNLKRYEERRGMGLCVDCGNTSQNYARCKLCRKEKVRIYHRAQKFR